MDFPINTVLLLAFTVGAVFLQIFLSKRESKIPGLVLPFISFLFSILFVLNMAVPPDGDTAGIVWEAIAAFLLSNIPTAVLLAIYFACRKPYYRKKQLDKMNVRDLD